MLLRARVPLQHAKTHAACRVLLFAFVFTPTGCGAQVVTTLAGSGVTGTANGAGTAATFSASQQGNLAVDGSGNVYVNDPYQIRRVTPGGTATTFAGSGVQGSANGVGAAAQFQNALGVAIDAAGNLFVADAGVHSVRRVTPAGAVSLFSGGGCTSCWGTTNGAAGSTRFRDPTGIAVDFSGNVFVSDYNCNGMAGCVRKLTTAGASSTFCSPGFRPTNVAVAAAGFVYVSSKESATLVKVTPAGAVSTLASPGASLGVAVDAAGFVFVSSGAYGIKMVSPSGAMTPYVAAASACAPLPDGVGGGTGGGGLYFHNATNRLYSSDCNAVRYIATPSPSPTNSPTPSPSPSPSRTGTPSPTRSSSTTPTASATATPCAPTAAPGSFCGGGALSPCPPGFSCAGGSTAPVPCAPASACPTAGLIGQPWPMVTGDAQRSQGFRGVGPGARPASLVLRYPVPACAGAALGPLVVSYASMAYFYCGGTVVAFNVSSNATRWAVQPQAALNGLGIALGRGLPHVYVGLTRVGVMTTAYLCALHVSTGATVWCNPMVKAGNDGGEYKPPLLVAALPAPETVFAACCVRNLRWGSYCGEWELGCNAVVANKGAMDGQQHRIIWHWGSSHRPGPRQWRGVRLRRFVGHTGVEQKHHYGRQRLHSALQPPRWLLPHQFPKRRHAPAFSNGH